MKITAGTKLTSLSMVKLAMAQGFALKIVENIFVEGEEFNEQTGKWEHWSDTEVQTGYEAYTHDEHTIVHQYLENGEIFACTMAEYDEWYEFNYPCWDDYDE